MRSTDPRITVLLVEDDALVGLDLGEALARAGYRTAGPVGTLAGALVQLRHRTPDLAIVDVRLRDGLSSELARELHQRQVPFVVHSAWRRDTSLCPELQAAPLLAKPALPSEVVATLNKLDRDTSR
ncbi:response regulator [Methylobacterium terricola]|uniref:Response regulator n=1 Tax=Methylobacterium terricola TaxID=2583531 RepID=A0A5C4L7Y4_9HYPH|nr:response regulator [Methylobacterium terricola]TNC05409.1 response regulator [Methylobacterium terricola]